MQLILKNSSLTFRVPQAIEDALASIYTNYNATKFKNFMSAIGGESGSIWNKIKVLWMPIFSGTDGNLYYNIKTRSIVGFNSSDALSLWTLSSDANNSNVAGFKGNIASVAGTDMSIYVNTTERPYNLTTHNICFFGIAPNNPNPIVSLNICSWRLGSANNYTTYSIKQQTDQIIFTKIETQISGSTAVSKNSTGFTTTLAYCMANSDGIIGLATNNSAYVAQTSKIFGDTETNLLSLSPCSKSEQTTNTYGALFSIFGAATSFTQTEAETMVNALNTFLS